jgi:hypothetical protein
MAMEQFAAGLAESGTSLFIQTQLWIVPTVQSIHIVALAILVMSAALLHVRLAGFAGADLPLQQIVGRYLPQMGWALAVLAVTGLVLVVGEPERELGSRLFWIKMALVVVAALLSWGMCRKLPAGTYGRLPVARRVSLRIASIAALTAWALIVICGRWIAYA